MFLRENVAARGDHSGVAQLRRVPHAHRQWLLKAAVAICITLTAWLAAAVEVRYQYDEAGRLRRVISADTSQTSYTLDAAGNRLQTQATLGAGLIQFAVASATVAEGSGQYTIAVTRTVKTVGAISIAYATQNVSAQAGVDYTAVSGTLSWANGDASSKTITVPILNNQLFQPVARSFDISLGSPTGGALLDGNVTARISIADDDPVFFSVSAPAQVNEGGGSVPVTITKSGGVTTQAYSVSYATVDGTEPNFIAIAGRDYAAASGTLTFASNQTSQVVSISIINDVVYELDEVFVFKLSNPTGGTALRSGGGSLGIAIVENDPAPVFSISSDVSVAENLGGAPLTVTKNGATELSFTIPFVTISGTALAGTDFLIPEPGTAARFSPEATSASIVVEFLDDTVFEGDEDTPGHETFQVRLATPPFGGRLGRDTATVTILENDLPPPRGYLAISELTLVSEADSVFNVPVLRIGGSFGRASAQCVVREGTARLSVDYTVIATTVNWVNGDAADKYCRFAAINDQVFREPVGRNFNVDLVNITGATDPGGLKTGFVAIIEDEPALDTTPPVPPTLSAPILGAANAVSLSWTAVQDPFTAPRSGLAGYRVYRNGVRIAQTNATTTSFVDRSAASFTTYAYEVTAFDAAGNESGRSLPRSVQTLDVEPPTRPTITSAVPVSSSQIDLSWTASSDSGSGLGAYFVNRSGTSIGFTFNTSISDTSPSLVPGATYQYEVIVLDIAGNSAVSPPVSVTVPLPPLVAPAWTLYAHCVNEFTCPYGSGPIPLQWSPVIGATRYEVEYATEEGETFPLVIGPFRPLASTTGTSITSPGIHGITDRYRVRACNATSCGPYSSLIYFFFYFEVGI